MSDKNFELWVNTKITDKELAEQLQAMCDEDSRNRSDFIRLLIKKEWNARQAEIVVAPVRKMINPKYTKAVA